MNQLDDLIIKQTTLIFDKNSFLRSERYRGLIITTLTTLSIGTVFYHFVEKLTWLDAIYFSVITLMTVGYGDISPETSLGKIFTIFYVLIGTGLIFAFVDALYSFRARKKDKNKIE